MGINIGLDIGAVSLKLAAIGAASDAPLLGPLGGNAEGFFPAFFPGDDPLSGRPVVLSRYRRIQGSPIQSTFDRLKEFYDLIPEHNV